MEKFAQVFKALSARPRLRIMMLFTKTSSDLCVCEIIDALHESQYNVSRHLKELKIAGLLKERRQGRWIYYSLAEPIDQFHKLVVKAVASIPEEILSEDINRLKIRLSLRERGECVVGLDSPVWTSLTKELALERREHVQKT